MSDPDPVLTPHDVADILRRDYETVLDALNSGDLLGAKKRGRWYIRSSAVDDFLRPNNSDAA